MTDQHFSKLVELMAHLRGPDGCPWDRNQNYDSIKGLMLEEVYEVVDAVNARDFENLEEELGDLLFQVIFYARLAEEENHFTIDGVTKKLYEKLMRRHPHVFGEVRARNAEEALESWRRVKESERGTAGGDTAAPRVDAETSASETQKPSILDGISTALPALLEAHAIGHRAAENGFDWPNIQDLFDKVEEELHELRLEVESAKLEDSSRAEEEVGDLLFAVSNLARYVHSDAASCLRRANQKFTRRFTSMEARASERGKTLRSMDAAELDALWNEVKRAEVR